MRALASNVGWFVNNKLGDMIKIVVACRQIVNSKLFHSCDNQRIIGQQAMTRTDGLRSVQTALVLWQNEDVQTKNRRSLHPVFRQISDFSPFTSQISHAISFDDAGADSLSQHHSVRHFVDYIKARNSENLFCGATTEQISTLIRVAEKGVDENICVYEKVGAGRQIFDQLRRHD